MKDLDLHAFKNRCLSAVLLKHKVGLAGHYGALLCEELGRPAPDKDPTAAELVELAGEVLAARAGKGAAGVKAVQKAAKKPAKKAEKKPEVKIDEVATATPKDLQASWDKAGPSKTDVPKELQEALAKADAVPPKLDEVKEGLATVVEVKVAKTVAELTDQLVHDLKGEKDAHDLAIDAAQKEAAEAPKTEDDPFADDDDISKFL